MLNEPEETASCCSFQDSLAPPEYRKWRRVHGLQLPLHPLQLAGWLALLVFATATFLVLVPALGNSIQQPIFGLLTGLFLVHIGSHLAALLIDPADPELLKIKSSRTVPEFDRSKHAHVIENGRCHLCNIITKDVRTKHCSVCNKCVSRFDHHCKWLNHCIGERNYVPFLMCVVSAVAATLVVLAVAIAELVLYHVNPEWLTPWDGSRNDSFTTSSTEFNASSATNSTSGTDAAGVVAMHDTVFLLVVAALGLLAAITAGLLLHLCFFHVYISFLGLTTYEYIRNYRQNMMSTSAPETASTQALDSEPKISPTKVYFCSSIGPSTPEQELRHRPSSLHCCDTSREYHQASQRAFYFCSLLEEKSRSPEFESRTFHCCSEFHQAQRSPNTDIEVAESYVHMSEQCTFCSFRVKKPSKTESNDKRCCLKSINKHHRWRRKWNCCSNVPDSPDSPGEPLGSVSGNSLAQLNGSGSVNNNQNLYQDSSIDGDSIRKNSISLRERTVRPWPLIRLRYLFRYISQLGHRRPRNRPSCQTVRQNQVRPLTQADLPSPVQTILPTSAIRSNDEESPRGMTLPALPPPPRRRLRNVADLQELADTLASIQQPQVVRAPTNYRRNRRKNILQARSPTLSPIHESGLSNPASPQPCRHATCSTISTSPPARGGGATNSDLSP